MVTLDVGTVQFAEIADNLQRGFEQIASDKNLSLAIRLDPQLPLATITDEKRLQQILKNLLSNAFKFTHEGGVELAIRRANGGWSPAHTALNAAAAVVAYSVTDTGIGIPRDKLRVIFEAFQQADGTTSRKYGGTGLGLSISREICRLLGGEITVESTPGKGSRFTLYLPVAYDFGANLPAHAARPMLVGQQGAQVVIGRESAPLLVPAELTDDRQNIQPGETRAADHRGRREVRPHPARPGARPRLQGGGVRDRQRRAAAGASLQPGADHARYQSAGHGRLAAARHSQAQPRNASHSDPHHFGRGSARARPADGRVLGARKAGRSRNAAAGAGAHRGVHRAAGQGAAAGRGRRPAARADRRRHRQRRRAWSRRCAPVPKPCKCCSERPFDCAVLDLVLPDMDGLQLVGDDPPRQLAPLADHHSHRQGRQLRGRGEAAQPGRVVHPQGARVAPAVVRRDRAVHASARRRHGRRQAPHHRSRATARGGARRTARADRRRRHPQHLLAHRRPRAAPGAGRCTPRAAAKASSSWRRPRTSTWC